MRRNTRHKWRRFARSERYLRHPAVRRIVSDDGTMLDVPFADPLILDDVRAAIWNELAEPRTADEVAAAVERKYDVDARTVRDDLATFLETLLERHLAVAVIERPVPVEHRQGADAGCLLAVDELIPNALAVRVYAHRASSGDRRFDCWTFVSDGLAAVGQKEIVVTVRGGADRAVDGYRRQLSTLYARFHYLALTGRTVDLGDVSFFGSRGGLIGDPGYSGIVYSTPQSFAGVPIPEDALAGIMLTRDEAQVADRFGAVRMTTLLGRAYRHFPCPTWAERDRHTLVTAAAMEHSILANVAKVRVPGVVAALTVTTTGAERPRPTGELADDTLDLADRQLTFEAPLAAHESIERALSMVRGDPIAFLTAPDPRADAALLWTPGLSGVRCLGAPGAGRTRVGANFVLFVPHGARFDVAVVEDGVVVRARGGAWFRMRTALHLRKGHSVPVIDDRMGLRIEWVGDESRGS